MSYFQHSSWHILGQTGKIIALCHTKSKGEWECLLQIIVQCKIVEFTGSSDKCMKCRINVCTDAMFKALAYFLTVVGIVLQITKFSTVPASWIWWSNFMRTQGDRDVILNAAVYLFCNIAENISSNIKKSFAIYQSEWTLMEKEQDWSHCITRVKIIAICEVEFVFTIAQCEWTISYSVWHLN